MRCMIRTKKRCICGIFFLLFQHLCDRALFAIANIIKKLKIIVVFLSISIHPSIHPSIYGSCYSLFPLAAIIYNHRRTEWGGILLRILQKQLIFLNIRPPPSVSHPPFWVSLYAPVYNHWWRGNNFYRSSIPITNSFPHALTHLLTNWKKINWRLFPSCHCGYSNVA